MPVWIEGNNKLIYPDEVFCGAEVMGLGAPISGDIPEVQEAFDQMLATETEEEMAAAAQAAEQLVLDELGYILILWARHSTFACGPTIEDWDPAFPLLTATYRES